jgi:hypothetical protein
LSSGATAGDELNVYAFSTFNLADVYTKAQSDARYVELTGDTMSGNLVTTGEQFQINRSNGNMARLTLANTSRNWTISNYGTQFGSGELAIADETAGAIRMVFEPSGAISVPAGQLRFPATQNASSNANTLDDYEEGSWTIAVTCTSGSVTLDSVRQIGSYVKIGRLVSVHGRFDITAVSSPSGLAFVSLPFVNATHANDERFRTAVNVTVYNPASGNANDFEGRLEEGSSSFNLYNGESAIPNGAAPQLKASTEIWFNGTYMTEN